MFDVVFLDADNTLFDFDRTQDKAIQQSLSNYSLPSNEQAIEQYNVINRRCWAEYDQGLIANEEINERRWQQWLEQVGCLNKVSAIELAEHYAQSLAEQCEKEDGAEELMMYLAQKHVIHIITNGFLSSQAHRWRKAGWESMLQGITVSAVVGAQKPNAKIFQLAMEAVGVTDPSRCLMIGDNIEADVFGAQQVGIKACWYQRKGAQNETDIKPDYVVQHLAELIPLI